MANDDVDLSYQEFLERFFEPGANPADVISLRNAIESGAKTVLQDVVENTQAALKGQKKSGGILGMILGSTIGKPSQAESLELLDKILKDPRSGITKEQRTIIEQQPPAKQVAILDMILKKSQNGSVKLNLNGIKPTKRNGPDPFDLFLKNLLGQKQEAAAVRKANPQFANESGMALTSADMGLQMGEALVQAAKTAVNAARAEERLVNRLKNAPAPTGGPAPEPEKVYTPRPPSPIPKARL